MSVHGSLGAQEMMQLMMDQSPDATLLCDMEGTVLRANPAFEQLFGWTSQELMHQMVPTIPADRKLEFVHKLSLMQVGLPVKDLETVRLHKSGARLKVILTAFPILQENGVHVSNVIVYRHGNEQVYLDEMVRKSDRLEAVAQLAASVAHEIRNPLTAIKGFVQLVQSTTKQHDLYFEIMFDEIERIEQIIKEFLLLAKPQAVHYNLISPRTLLEHTVTLMTPQATMNGVEIQVSYDSDLHDIYCEENHIKQLLVNLMKNAIEAMPDGGNLFLSASNLSQDTVIVSVRDGGCGISAEQLARLGEPYYTTKTKGTGLGLMVSQKIVQSHGGQMEFFSQPGQGTTVNVTLPIRSLFDA